MRSESMLVAAGSSVTEAGRQKHRLARLDRLGRMALWSRHHANICLDVGCETHSVFHFSWSCLAAVPRLFALLSFEADQLFIHQQEVECYLHQGCQTAIKGHQNLVVDLTISLEFNHEI